jgi:hypothetical protein
LRVGVGVGIGDAFCFWKNKNTPRKRCIFG